MKSFKDFIKPNKKISILSWPGHETLRSLNESWTDTDTLDMYPYDRKFHDHPDIEPTELTDRHKTLLRRYTSGIEINSLDGPGTSRVMNAHLRYRGGSPKPTTEYQHPSTIDKAVKAFSSVFTKENTNRKPATAYGGVPLHIGKQLQDAGEGSQHFMPPFVSASSHKGTALQFAKGYHYKEDNIPNEENHVIEYNAEPGTFVSAAKLAKFKENEVIFNHGHTITYHGTDTYDDKHPVTGKVTKIHVHRVTVHAAGRKPLEEYNDPYKGQ